MCVEDVTEPARPLHQHTVASEGNSNVLCECLSANYVYHQLLQYFLFILICYFFVLSLSYMI